MLVKFSENKETDTIINEPKVTEPMVIDLPEIIAQKNKEDEKLKYTPTQDQLDLLEKILNGKYKGPEKVKSNYEVFSPNEDELSKLQEILGVNNVTEDSKLKFNLQDETVVNETEDFKSDIVFVNNVEETHEQPDQISETIEDINVEELQNEQDQEPLSDNVETQLSSPIVEISSTYDDKKKIDELFQKNEDYKILNYTKRYG